MNDPEVVLWRAGGYQDLNAYQMSEHVHDGTVAFCERLVCKDWRMVDQMTQAARSAKQNIAEGSQRSNTSKGTELKLISVARASLEELLVDYTDFLRQHNLNQWDKDDARAKHIRRLAYRSNRSYRTYESYIEERTPEIAANSMICLVCQTTFLLDQLLRSLAAKFEQEGGFTERLYRVRTHARGY